MSGDESRSDWWVTLHAEKRGPYPDHASAFNAAKEFKRQNPSKHVAVRDPKGISTGVD
jgi:hypothetical protein